jgi:hypothetical protein
MDSKKIALVGATAFIGLLYLTFRLLRFPAGLLCTAFVGRYYFAGMYTVALAILPAVYAIRRIWSARPVL